jgi:hypothetical protein
LILFLVAFWVLTWGDSQRVKKYDILPNLYLLILVLSFVLPIPLLSKGGRSRAVATFKRISIGGIAEAHDGKFGDILFADALTSYAKVLGDLFVALCMFVTPGQSSTARPNRSCGGVFFVPFVMAIPSLIRLRQCIIEYLRVRRGNKRAGSIGSHGWGGQHLANALKYSTAFPVIILSALQRGYDPTQFGMTEKSLYRAWLVIARILSYKTTRCLTMLRLVAVIINSLYSFYWDVAKDWDLSMFSKDRDSDEYPWGLRKHRYFHLPEFYYCAVVVDFMLRCTWSFKLSPHLDHFNDLEGGIFLMEVLEVLRRWIWIFFRVETEWGRFSKKLIENVHIANGNPVRNNRGPGTDEILLGDYQNKYDSD